MRAGSIPVIPTYFYNYTYEETNYIIIITNKCVFMSNRFRL